MSSRCSKNSRIKLDHPQHEAEAFQELANGGGVLFVPRLETTLSVGGGGGGVGGWGGVGGGVSVIYAFQTINHPLKHPAKSLSA